MNPYENYYIKQAGSGIATYSGTRYQKGNGFFRRLISGFALPLLKYFGRHGLETVGNVVTDIKENPDVSIKEVLKRQTRNTLTKVTDDGSNRVKKFIQSGKGIKNKTSNLKRKSTVAKVIPTKKRRSKSSTFLS